MTIDEERKPEGAPERSPKAGEGAPSGVEGNWPKRFSAQRKMAIVARLLRGEPLDLVAREANVSVAKLTEWRERALEPGPAPRSPPSNDKGGSKPGSSMTPVLRRRARIRSASRDICGRLGKHLSSRGVDRQSFGKPARRKI